MLITQGHPTHLAELYFPDKNTEDLMTDQDLMMVVTLQGPLELHHRGMLLHMRVALMASCNTGLSPFVIGTELLEVNLSEEILTGTFSVTLNVNDATET